MFMHKFKKRLLQSTRGEWSTLCKCVAYTLLPADMPYISGHVVDRECDILVESFLVYSLNVGQVGSSCEGSQALFFIFLSNIPYV